MPEESAKADDPFVELDHAKADDPFVELDQYMTNG
jgi:hypothetical protein